MTSAQARDLAYGCRELANGDLTDSHGMRERGMRRTEHAGVLDGASDGQREVMLVPSAESVRTARDFTAVTLRGWNLDALIDEAVIVASELVTNAIRHGMCGSGRDQEKSGVEIAWQRRAGRIVCTVTDCTSMPPMLEQADMSSESGRGLQVVSALAAAWGWVILGAREKAVWASFLAP